jgi:RNA polymerase sigma factor (sigma-70 family)
MDDNHMPSSPPEALQSLASAPDTAARDSAWEAFLAAYSTVILHVAQTMGGDHDAVMDRYAFALDALRRDDCRRLRGYVADGRGSFTTWLVVVTRRLCVDEHRHRYGRPQGGTADSAEQHAQRRQLADLISSELDVDALEAPSGAAPDEEMARRQVRAALEAALARLDPSDRLILRLRFEDELPVPEIARLLDLGSPFRLYRRLGRVLSTVRSDLELAGIRDADA